MTVTTQEVVVTTQELERHLEASVQELTKALLTPQFYVEMLIIGVVFVLAMIVAAFFNQHIRKRFDAKPPKHFTADSLKKPLVLLMPILAVLLFSISKPFAEAYGDGGFWVNAAVRLTIALIMARAVILGIKSKGVAYLIATVIMLLAVLNATGFTDGISAYLNSMAFTLGDFRISMLSLVKGLIILVVVFWLAGLISNTLEMYLRRSSSLSYNARELTVKLVNVVIYFIAFIITLSSVGVDLTAFAVFGGALGVGIGLGLQKITSNFISGISLLMEKSIKIGDMIEIGAPSDKVYGWVRQLNIRYTLIESFDGREILIPNEELMSSRVVNWTYSNVRARIEINVGVAYGSDPNKVIELILEAANEHPKCLKDPAPGCYMLEFGDSSLNFLLVFWVADVRDGRWGPKSEVMIAIMKKLDAAGITIPFPQRDIHIVSGGALPATK
jgi:small-conductance mechanosensitive channel